MKRKKENYECTPIYSLIFSCLMIIVKECELKIMIKRSILIYKH